MLVITRRENESLILDNPKDPGRPIRVMLVRAEGGKIRIGIDAPRDVLIHRAELHPQEVPS